MPDGDALVTRTANQAGRSMVPGYAEAVASNEVIFVRPLTVLDITDRYLTWFDDDEVTRYLEAHHLKRQEALEFLEWGQKNGLRHMFAVCDAKTGLHIGNVKLGDFNLKSGTSDLVTVIGDRNYWGRGIATQAIRMMSKVAFEKFNIRKLYGGIYSKNIGSINAYLRAGWVVEAVFYAHCIEAGELNDFVAVSCFNPKMHPQLPKFPLPLPSPAPEKKA